MKKILLLIVILAGLVVAVVTVQKQQNASLNTAISSGTVSREMLLPDLDVIAVQGLRIKDEKAEVNIVINADRKSATVTERDGYPASLDRINTALEDLRAQKVANKAQIGKSLWAENHIQAPGAGPDGIGTLVELLAPGSKVLRSLVLGEPVAAAGGNAPPMGGNAQRLVRIPEDGDTIWVVSNTFYDLEAKPSVWLDKAFIDVQKIREVAVTALKAEDSWVLKRIDPAKDEFALSDAKVGEGLDPTKLAAHTLLSAPTFEDVISKDKAGDALKDATKVKLTTYDGFVYDVQVAKHSKDGSDKYFMNVSVTAEIPQARPAVKDEKPEDKKKKDEEFAARKKTLEDKLAKEKRFAGWIFEVTEYTVSSLLKTRPEIVTVTAKGEPSPDGAPANPGSIPGLPNFSMPAGPRPSVNSDAPPGIATPPVSVPAVPKVEVKPAPSPSANPATGESAAPAPATPAPAPAPAPAAPAAPAPATPAGPAK